MNTGLVVLVQAHQVRMALLVHKENKVHEAILVSPELTEQKVIEATQVIPEQREQQVLLEKQAAALGKKVAGLSDEALACLNNYHWHQRQSWLPRHRYHFPQARLASYGCASICQHYPWKQW